MTNTRRIACLLTVLLPAAWTLCPRMPADAARLVRTFGRGRLGPAAGVAVDPVTKYVYVASPRQQRVLIFDGRGRYIGSFGGLGQGRGRFLTPWGVAADGRGDVFVTDTGSYEKPAGVGTQRSIEAPPRIERFDRRGRFRGQITLSSCYVRGMAARAPGGALAVTCIRGDAHLIRYDYWLRNPRVLPLTWNGGDGAPVAADSQGYWTTVSWDMKHDRVMAGSFPSGGVTETEIARVDRHGAIRKHAVIGVRGEIAGIAADAAHVYVAERIREVYEVGPTPERDGKDRILVYDRRLRLTNSFPINPPNGVAVDNGHLYVAGDHGVQIFHVAK